MADQIGRDGLAAGTEHPADQGDTTILRKRWRVRPHTWPNRRGASVYAFKEGTLSHFTKLLSSNHA